MNKNPSDVPTTAATTPRGVFTPLTAKIIKTLSVNDIVEVRGKTQLNGFIPINKAIITSVGTESIIVNYDLENPFNEVTSVPLRIDEDAQICDLRAAMQARRLALANAAAAEPAATTEGAAILTSFKGTIAATAEDPLVAQIQNLMIQDSECMINIATALARGKPKEVIEKLELTHSNLRSLIMNEENQTLILSGKGFDMSIVEEWRSLNIQRRSSTEDRSSSSSFKAKKM